MNTKATTTVAATLLFLFSASAAHAADGKSYPASACNPATPQKMQVDLGAMYNISAEQAYIDCPIIQDGNGGMNVALVAARDLHPDRTDPATKHLDQLYCLFFATKYLDSPGRPAMFFSSEGTTEGSSERFQPLRLNGGWMPPASSVEVSCRIPPATVFGSSGVGQYFAEEP